MNNLFYYITESGDPWGIWCHGHSVELNKFLEIANEELFRQGMKPVSLNTIERVFAFDEYPDTDFSLGICEKDQKGSMPITWISGEKIESVD